jgi:hypothetical protein
VFGDDLGLVRIVEVRKVVDCEEDKKDKRLLYKLERQTPGNYRSRSSTTNVFNFIEELLPPDEQAFLRSIATPEQLRSPYSISLSRAESKDELRKRQFGRYEPVEPVGMPTKKREEARKAYSKKKRRLSPSVAAKKHAYPPANTYESDGTDMVVGENIYAQDYLGGWYRARVKNVEQDDGYVDVHFMNWSNDCDESIDFGSGRLRKLREAPAVAPVVASAVATVAPPLADRSPLPPLPRPRRPQPLQDFEPVVETLALASPLPVESSLETPQTANGRPQEKIKHFDLNPTSSDEEEDIDEDVVVATLRPDDDQAVVAHSQPPPPPPPPSVGASAWWRTARC